MNPLPHPEVELDWTIDGAKRLPAMPGELNSTILESGGQEETLPLLGDSAGNGDDNTADIDDWEGLPWYRKPSVRGPVFRILGGQVLTSVRSGFLVVTAVLSFHDGVRRVWHRLLFLWGICDF